MIGLAQKIIVLQLISKIVHFSLEIKQKKNIPEIVPFRMKIKKSQSYISDMRNSVASRGSNKSQSLSTKIPIELRRTIKSSQDKKRKSQVPNVNDLYKEFTGMVNNNKCSICLAVMVDDSCWMADCKHEFCEQCLTQYLTYKIDAMEEVLCPNDACDYKLDTQAPIFTNLPEKYQQKYRKQQLWKQTVNNPDLKICPKEKCEDGIVDLRKIPPKCDKCEAEFCAECMMALHPGQPCDRNFEENFRQWRRCPKCKMFIQKTEGCNHITCRCKHEFCFVCLSDWSDFHYNCRQQRQLQLIDPNTSSCPKLTAFLIILAFPLVLVGILLFIVLGMAFGIIMGAFMGLFFPICECGICMIIITPVTIAAGAIIAPFYILVIFLVPSSYLALQTYFATIKGLWQGF